MPRYYFHIGAPTQRFEDPEGAILPNVESARMNAIDSLRSLISEDVRRGVLELDEYIEVQDARGSTLMTVRSNDALTIASRGRQHRQGVSASAI